MSISVIQVSGKFTTTPISFTVAAGNTIIVCVRTQATGGIQNVVVSDSDGIYARDEAVFGTQHCASVHRMNRSSGGVRSITIAVSFGGSFIAVDSNAFELSSRGAIFKDCGVKAINSFGATGGSGNTPVTAANAEFAIGLTHTAGGALASITVQTTTPAWTEAVEELTYVPRQTGECDYKSLTAAGSYGGQWTYSGSVNPISLIVTYADGALEPAIIPPPGGGGPTAPPVPCNPASTSSNGGHGQAGCSTGGTGFVSHVAATEGIPVHADPVDGESMVGAPAVDVWIDYYHRDDSSGITRYGRAGVTLAHPNTYEGGYKPSGLQALGDIEYGISNEQGGHESPSINIKYADHIDRFIRNLLETEELEGDEVHIKMASPTAQNAASAPRVVARGIVQETPMLESRMMASLSAADPIFSEYGPLGPERMWPRKIPAGIFTTAPPDTLSMCWPWLYGEKSDEGSTDPLTGHSTARGLMPLIYAGQMAYGTAPTAVVPTSQGANDLGTFGNLGWSGGDGWTSDGTVDHDHYKFVYGVQGNRARLIGGGRSSTASPSGTVYGFRSVWNATAETYDYFIGFLVPPEYPAWDLFNNPAPSTANIRYKIAAATPSNPYPDWQYIIYWHSPTDGLQWGAPAAADLWDVYIAMGHEIDIYGVYGTDNGHGDPNATPNRVRIDLDARTDIRVPGYRNWTLPTNYVELTDPVDGTIYWPTLIFVDPTSPLTIDHKAGRITMAFNASGVKGNTGLPLLYVESCKHHWLENAILNDWTSGPWSDDVTFPQWQDGTPKVRSTTFEERHYYQVASSVDGQALRCSWYVNQQANISTFIGEWNKTESFIGYNSHGQFISFGLDETIDTSTWVRIRHHNDIFGPIRRQGGLQRENNVSVICDWDPDFEKWRNAVISVNDADAINRYKGRRKDSEQIGLSILNYQSDASWVASKRLQRLRTGLTYIDVTGKLDWLDIEVGDGVLLTTIEGPGASGYTDRACYVMRKKINLSAKPMTVTLSLWDVNNLMASTSLPNGLDQVWTVSNDAGTDTLLISNDPDHALAILN